MNCVPESIIGAKTRTEKSEPTKGIYLITTPQNKINLNVKISLMYKIA